MSAKKSKTVKPKPCKVWCPVEEDGTPCFGRGRASKRSAVDMERFTARASWRKPRPIHQFTLTPVRRKKR